MNTIKSKAKTRTGKLSIAKLWNIQRKARRASGSFRIKSMDCQLG